MMLQMAATLLLACDACQRSPAAIQLYRQLSAAGGASCGPAVHAAGARAYLRDAGSSEQSLAAALAVLEAHAEALLGLQDGALAEAASAAAACCLPGLDRSPAARRQRWDAALAAAAGASAEQQYAQLLPPVRAELWGLRLLAACGSAEPAALQAAAQQAARAVADAAGGAQLLLLLELLPAWAGGLQPAAGHLDALLECAAVEGVLDPADPLHTAVAGTLARLCGPLRSADPGWAQALSEPAQARLPLAASPAAVPRGTCLRCAAAPATSADDPTAAGAVPQVAVLLAGDALGDVALTLEAFAALEQASALPHVRPAGLQQQHQLRTCMVAVGLARV